MKSYPFVLSSLVSLIFFQFGRAQVLTSKVAYNSSGHERHVGSKITKGNRCRKWLERDVHETF